MDHFFTQLRWKTVQHSSQDQTRDLRPSSLQQIGHSYRLCDMSSWMRVARSSAVDFAVTLGGGALGCLAFPFPFKDGVASEARPCWNDGAPGTKSGTSGLNVLSCECSAPSNRGPFLAWSGLVNLASKPRALIPRVRASGPVSWLSSPPF